MALLWTESCQRIRTGTGYSRAYFSGGGVFLSWSATGGRNNGPSLQGGLLFYPKDPAPTSNTIIAGIRINPQNDGSILTVRHNLGTIASGAPSTGGDRLQVGVWRSSAGAIEVRRGNGVGATSTTLLATTAGGVLSAGTLYYITAEFTIHGSTGTTKVYLDGTEVPELTLTGQNTDPLGVSGWNCFQIVASSSHIWCDFYLLDGSNPSGDDPNEAVMDARVDYVGPNGNGYVSQFTGSDGNSTDNYLLIDENDPNDDTDYVQSTTAAKDAYALGAFPAAGATIIGVTSFASVRKTDSGVAVMRTGLRVGGTDYMQSNNKAMPVSYTEIRHHWGHDPSDGAWSEAVFNGAEIVVEKV